MDALDPEQAVNSALAVALSLVRLASPEEIPREADVLAAFSVLIRRDPSWNAARDTLRELVYYHNCLASGRHDALPAVPHRMAVRLARHLFLYFKSRLG
jgi:hypothetical protein